jgi:hypothetical protein
MSDAKPKRLRPVHISDRVHRRATAFCDTHGLFLSSWVSALVLDAAKAPPNTAPKR